MSLVFQEQALHRWVMANTPSDAEKFFVEAGAHDGVGDSTTGYLEIHQGWQGICVEPAPAFQFLLECERTCFKDNRALWKADNEVVSFRHFEHDPELSGIVQNFVETHWDRENREHHDIQKKTVTLVTLLKEYDVMLPLDFLSLDTEGSELEILAAHDWTWCPIRLLTVEHNNVMKRKTTLRALMKRQGYRLVNENEVEDWYQSMEPM